MDKFNELLEKYGVTAEEITFEYADLSDEELEAKFEEVFSASNDPDPEDGDQEIDSSEGDADEGNGEEEFAVRYTVEAGDVRREFSVSLQEKLQAISDLVNEVYADDETWYAVEVYDDDKYVIMIDWYSNKAYRQSYKVRKDVYSLTGERVEVFARWLTTDEIGKLDEMKASYAEISDKLSK